MATHELTLNLKKTNIAPPVITVHQGDSAEVLKAATAMPGVALRGETCGAVIGPIMALGLEFGRDRPEDHEAFLRTLQAAHRFSRIFEEEFGSCMCAGVQERLFGRGFDLLDPADMQEFAACGAASKCRIPAGRAVRIAGEMILAARREGAPWRKAPPTR